MNQVLRPGPPWERSWLASVAVDQKRCGLPRAACIFPESHAPATTRGQHGNYPFRPFVLYFCKNGLSDLEPSDLEVIQDSRIRRMSSLVVGHHRPPDFEQSAVEPRPAGRAQLPPGSPDTDISRRR